MITRNHTQAKWQQALTTAISCPYQLLELLELDKKDFPQINQVHSDFATRVPINFINKMKKGDPNDPLLKQVLPSNKELLELPGFSKDPLEELAQNPLSGLLHKYHGRVLLTLTSACAVNCRYCFRRHFPYEDNRPGREGWEDIFTYIQSHPDINEVILSGGDPLLAPDSLLTELFNKLSVYKQVQTIRIHTRLPVMIPSRITDELISLIKHSGFQIIMVMHCNHPNEIDEAFMQSCQKLWDAGCHLLNQSVLLDGVNHHASVLITLSKKLFSAKILPYYIHLLDKVKGSAHFDIDLAGAKKLEMAMREALPGYLVPKFVFEKAGAKSKMPI